MKLTDAQIAILRSLLDGQSIAASKLGKPLSARLLQEELLTVSAHGSRRTYSARNANALRAFLEAEFDEFRLDRGSKDSRHAQAARTGNSKLYTVRACPGFPVNAFRPIECRLNGRPLVIDPPEGSFMFIADWQAFEVPADVVIIGVENVENFRLIRLQEAFLTNYLQAKRPLFVSRYPQSTDLRQWLQQIPNNYIHFGDFDLAGINIYLTEFARYLGPRASLLIPDDIETRLAHGTRQRYDAQFAKYHRITAADPKVQALIDAIHRHKRAYDQEGYI